MKIMLAVASLLLFVGPAVAQAPSGAPAGTTGLCKDGSYWSGAVKKGACRGHKGVQTWYAESAPSAAASAPTKSMAAAPAPTATPAKPVAAAPIPVAPSKPSAMATSGGPGQVWVNTASKVYHCQGDRYYGKTKAGSYMTEAAAVSAGNRPDHGKACH